MPWPLPARVWQVLRGQRLCEGDAPIFPGQDEGGEYRREKGRGVFRKGRLGLKGGGSRQLGEEPTGERLSMLWYFHAMEYHSALKRNKTNLHVQTGRDL